jgi:signal transduction histidine kinase
MKMLVQVINDLTVIVRADLERIFVEKRLVIINLAIHHKIGRETPVKKHERLVSQRGQIVKGESMERHEKMRVHGDDGLVGPASLYLLG